MAVGAGLKLNTTHRRRMRRPEQVFQASLVKSLAMVLDPSCLMFAVPNGGWRTKREAAILIGQGVVPGIPDLMILFNGTAAGMELKAGRGATSDSQDKVHVRFARAGIPIAIIRTLDEALTFLDSAGVPFRIKRPQPPALKVA
jgi:hypothetical protein